MRIVKYTLIGAVIGLVVGLVLALTTVGISCSGCKEGCNNCVNSCGGGLENCFRLGCLDHSCLGDCGENIVSCGRSFIGGTCGFLEGCDSCYSSFGISCFTGCIDGCKEECYFSCRSGEDCVKGCKECGSGCKDGCKDGADGIKNDIDQTYKNVGDNSKAKHYLIYLTILGTWIGAVLGITLTVQENRKRKKDIKNRNERIARNQAEDERKHMQDDEQWFKNNSERLWQEMKNWLSS